MSSQISFDVIKEYTFENTTSSLNDRTMRSPILFGILAILLLRNASAELALDPKPGLALRNQPHQKRRYDTWQNFLAPDGWKVSYITFEHFMPIQVAAAGLQRLYLTLAVSASTSQYGSLAPSNAVVLRLGSLNLTMWSNERFHGQWCRRLRLRCGQ